MKRSALCACPIGQFLIRLLTDTTCNMQISRTLQYTPHRWMAYRFGPIGRPIGAWLIDSNRYNMLLHFFASFARLSSMPNLLSSIALKNLKIDSRTRQMHEIKFKTLKCMTRKNKTQMREMTNLWSKKNQN